MSLLFQPMSADATEDFDLSPAARRHVSVGEATHLGPVFAAIRSIVDYASTLPVDFYTDGPGGVRERTNWPLLAQNINAEVGFSNWIGQVLYGMVTIGNTVGAVTAVDAERRPLMIELAEFWSGGEDSPWFVNGALKPDSLVAHVPWIVPTGKKLGLSPIAHFAAMARAGLSAQDYADVGRGGGIPPAHLKNTAKVLNRTQAAKIQQQAAASFASGLPFTSGNDWDLTVQTIPPSHAQFIQTLQMTATQIAAIYGIDPREVGGSASDSLTYSNDESRALNRGHNMRPYLTRVETAFSRWLPRGQYMKFNVGATIRADIKTRTDVVGAQIADGRLSVNEARALEERGPVPGGDFYNIPRPPTEPVNRTGDAQ
ncbi:phage portal protein [Promicromonospora sp. NPDC050880]|uniref:phage portal protein n=1 Tax=Promicromonospora sp. NPDC050880 TaxID=3364406 RepID=UPI0037B1D19F